MALINKALGAKLYFSIGHRGQRPDVYAGRLASPTTITMGPRGPMETANVILWQPDQSGNFSKRERLVNTLYCRDRSEIVPDLDGTTDAPKAIQTLAAEQAAELDAFLASREQVADVSELLA